MTDPKTAEGAKMERTWTPEPWLDQWEPLPPQIVTVGRGLVTITDEDYQRARACVNALAGVADPAGFVRQAKETDAAFGTSADICADLRQQLQAAQEQRDKLAEVVHEYWNDHTFSKKSRGSCHCRTCVKARAALPPTQGATSA